MLKCCLMLFAIGTLACQTGQLETVQFLLQNQANIEARDMIGRKPLHFAACAGSLDIVKCLVDNRAGINVKDVLGRSAVQFASGNGHSEVVAFLLENGATCQRNQEGCRIS